MSGYDPFRLFGVKQEGNFWFTLEVSNSTFKILPKQKDLGLVLGLFGFMHGSVSFFLQTTIGNPQITG
jgi:hypothetical protein